MRVSVGARELHQLMGCVVVAAKSRNEMAELVAVELNRAAYRSSSDCSTGKSDFGVNYRERRRKAGSEAARAMHPEDCPRCMKGAQLLARRVPNPWIRLYGFVGAFAKTERARTRLSWD